MFFPEGSEAAESFTRERLLRILEGRGDGVVRGLRAMGTKRGLTGAKKKTLDKVYGYLAGNLDRMRYHAYLSKGYPIASGRH